MAREYYGLYDKSLVCVHGGAGAQDPSRVEGAKAIAALREISAAGMEKLTQGSSRQEVAVYCLGLLEDDPQFNAGLGSALQADGMARLSAALMDGGEQAFSGVIAASYLRNPSLLVAALQTRRARVVTGPGVELLARQLGVPVQSVLTEERINRWRAQVLQDNAEFLVGYDTVGVIVRDREGHLAAGASTGGRGFEFPGRVSDTPTVAGTYASRFAAICVTGYGEQIVDDAVAARLETRVRDGMVLERACKKALVEAEAVQREYGWIAASRNAWAACYTTNFMPFAVCGEDGFL